jgi:uncharacterized membrane protein
MDPNLYQAARQLPPGDARVDQLYRLATSPAHPDALAEKTRKALFMVAALLLASGLIFWIAANWQEQSRLFRLGLIEAALAASVLLACLWPRARLAALLCATLVLGGLLAFVGQTYQTGADAWQLFVVWAGLALVWVCLVRSDLLWCLWVLIAATGIVMWTGRFDLWNVFFIGAGLAGASLVNIGLWVLLAVVPALVSLVPALRVHGGMGWWSHRVALALALFVWASMGLVRLFDEGVVTDPVQLVALVLVAAALGLSWKGRFQDFSSLCMAAMALNALLLAPLLRWMFHFDGLVAMAAFGVVETVVLGSSLGWLLEQKKRMQAQAHQQQEVM